MARFRSIPRPLRRPCRQQIPLLVVGQSLLPRLCKTAGSSESAVELGYSPQWPLFHAPPLPHRGLQLSPSVCQCQPSSPNLDVWKMQPTGSWGEKYSSLLYYGPSSSPSFCVLVILGPLYCKIDCRISWSRHTQRWGLGVGGWREQIHWDFGWYCIEILDRFGEIL